MTYRVLERASSQARWNNTVNSYVVSDQPDGWNSEDGRWPWIVEFQVTVGLSQEDQFRRAKEYAAYLNSHKVIPAIAAPVTTRWMLCLYCKCEKGHDPDCPAD